jgi:hypothetical protein
MKSILETKAQEKFVSKDGYDLCVLCKTKTPYKTETRVDMRNNYIEGCGQLCDGCYNQIFLEEEIKNAIK